MTIDQSLLPANRRKTGERLLEILQKESGCSMPSEGFLAGQSVTSAFMQMHNLEGVVYNDLDLFFEYSNKGVLLKEGLWHEKIHEPIQSVTATKLNSSAYEVDEFKEYVGDHSEYAGVPFDERILKLSRGIIINKVSRNSDLNHIVYTPLTSYDGIDKNLLYEMKAERRAELHNRILAKNVLRSFDLNSVKIGIDLKSGEVITEKTFNAWVANRQLALDHVQTPIQSFIRFMDKLEHAGNYGNIELELAKTFCLLTYRNLAGFSVHAKKARAKKQSTTDFEKINILYDLTMSAEWTKASKEYLAEKLEQNSPATFFESAIQAFKDLPQFERIADLNAKFGDYGINLIGQKYYERALKHKIVMEYFEFIAIEKCYIVQPRKVPRLVQEFGIEFFMYASNSGLGFLEDHQSIINPVSLANPIVDRKTKSVISSFGRLPYAQRALAISALFSNNKLREPNVVDTEFLTGLSDPVNQKYIDLASRHRAEINKISKVANLRQFYSCLKKLYNAIDKAFKIQNEYLFFAMYNKFESAVSTINRFTHGSQSFGVIELADDVYNDTMNVEEIFSASVEDYYKKCSDKDLSLPLYHEVVQFKKYLSQGMQSVCSEEFVEFCLNAYLSSNERQSAHKRIELNQKIPQQVLQKVIELFDKKVTIEIRELNTALELENEGFKMSHCVGGYSTYVQSGRSRIFSIALKTSDGYEFSTLEIQSHATSSLFGSPYNQIPQDDKDNKWRFIQNRGLRNSAPSAPLQSAGHALLAAINEYEKQLEQETVIIKSSRHSSALAKQVGISR